MINSQNISALEDLHHSHQDVLHQPFYIRGLLFAVCASPDIPMPEQWFPWIIKDSGSIDAEQVNQLSDLLMNMLKEQLQAMRDDKVMLPDDCQYPQQQQNLQHWLTGLLAGHSLLEKTWQQGWDLMTQNQDADANALSLDLKRCLKMFSTFADPTTAIRSSAQSGGTQYAAKLETLAPSLDAILRDYVRISGVLVGHLPNQFEVFEQMPGQLQ
ncbi:MAG: UPF0149 family protein [Aestuariibacter sp.]